MLINPRIQHCLRLSKRKHGNFMDAFFLVDYFNKGKCKVLVGLCKGKHSYDKRQVAKDKQTKMDIARAMKNN